MRCLRALNKHSAARDPSWGLILAPGLPDCQDGQSLRGDRLLLLAHLPSIGACARAIDRSLQPGCSTPAHAIYTWPIRAGLGSPDKRNRRVSRLWRHGDKKLSASTCSANNFGPQPLTQPSTSGPFSGQWPPPCHPGPRHGLLAHHLSFHAARCGKACPFPRPSFSHVTSGSGGWTNPRFSLG